MSGKRVVVHVGLPKAASTSLQAALAQARPELAAAGIAYPPLGGAGVKDQRALRAALAGGAPRALRRQVAEGLRRGAQGAETLVLSGETISATDPVRLRALLDAAGFAGAPLVAVAVLRDAAGWLNSQYAFEAAQFRHVETFAPYVRARLGDGTVDPCRTFRAWMHPPVAHFVAVPLRACGDGRPILPRLLAAMALPATLADCLASVRNVAPDPRTVAAGRRLAARLSAHQRGRRHPRARALLRAAAEREGWTGRFCGLDPELATHVARRTAADHDRFARKVWNAPWDRVYDMPDPAAFARNEREAPVDETEAAALARVVESVAPALAAERPGVIGWLRARAGRGWAAEGG